SRTYRAVSGDPDPCFHGGFTKGFDKRFFHGGNTGSNPVGDAKSFQQLTVSLYLGTKKAQFSLSMRMHFIEAAVFSHRSRHFEQAQVRNTSQQTGLNQQPFQTPEETNDAALRTPLLNRDGLGICIQCDPAGGVAKEFLCHLDICSVCSEQ